ncbi:TPA: phage tail protein, partial [Clostridioides difficile]|nr:phage tail protein [Clostridioides difficile]
FMIREIGYLDDENNLIAISKYKECYKPSIEQGAVVDMKVKTVLIVSNVNNIELKIDPTIIFATLKDIQDLETKIGTVNTKIDTTKTELNSKVGDTTLLTTTDKTNIVNALNEVKKTSVDSIETTAEKTSYNNATSKLNATNVQGAIDEIVAEVRGNRSSIISSINDNLIPM